MWRSNDSVTFCTKGIENFLLAYEETGDPFYSCTLNAQVAYAKEHVHANTGECRDIGAVKDFMLKHKALGKVEYAEKALRLFQELREKLSEDNLFSQGRATSKRVAIQLMMTEQAIITHFLSHIF